MTEPKPIYWAGVTYRTPSGRKVYFAENIAGTDMEEIETELRHRLESEVKYGRRKVAEVLNDFSAKYITHQIGTK